MQPKVTVRHVILPFVFAASAYLAPLPGEGIRVSAHSWIAECNIGFSNEFALSNILDQARTTFTVETGLTSGELASCDPGEHATCWFYRQRCGTPGYVNVDALNYWHFHLGFEDESLSCFVDGGFGRQVGNTCVAPDWSKEPRSLYTHDAEKWIKVWLADRVTGEPRIFDVTTIRVEGSNAAQVWFKKADGSWWYWSSLAPGWWDLSGWVFNVVELRIRAANGSVGPVQIDDIVIRA